MLNAIIYSIFFYIPGGFLCSDLLKPSQNDPNAIPSTKTLHTLDAGNVDLGIFQTGGQMQRGWFHISTGVICAMVIPPLIGNPYLMGI